MKIVYKIIDCPVAKGDRIVIVTGEKAIEYHRILSKHLGYSLTNENKGIISAFGIEVLNISEAME